MRIKRHKPIKTQSTKAIQSGSVRHRYSDCCPIIVKFGLDGPAARLLDEPGVCGYHSLNRWDRRRIAPNIKPNLIIP